MGPGLAAPGAVDGRVHALLVGLAAVVDVGGDGLQAQLEHESVLVGEANQLLEVGAPCRYGGLRRSRRTPQSPSW